MKSIQMRGNRDRAGAPQEKVSSRETTKGSRQSRRKVLKKKSLVRRIYIVDGGYIHIWIDVMHRR